MKPVDFKRFVPARSCRPSLVFIILLGAGFLVGGLGTREANGQGAALEFKQPANDTVFSSTDEIPILLRAFAPDDVFPTAELFADGGKIANLSYCCALCPCAAPQNGWETLLQIPVPWSGTMPPSRPFQGWSNPAPECIG